MEKKVFTFSKEGIQMAIKHMKKYSTPVVIRGIQTKTTIKYDFTPTWITIFKKKTKNRHQQQQQKTLENNKYGNDMEKLKPSTLLVGM